MKSFKPHFEITPIANLLGFEYGSDCFGPKVENRSLNATRKSLLDANCTGPDIVYSISMDVGRQNMASKFDGPNKKSKNTQ